MRIHKIAALLLAGMLFSFPAHSQTFVVASCPSGTTNGAAGQTGRPYAIDIYGNVCGTNAALTPVVTSALATSLVLKNAPGNLYSLNISADSTLSGAAWWAMVHDTTAAPAAGAVTPKKCFALASGTTMLSLDFSVPIKFATGISVTVSTTGCFTQTDSVHAFISGDVQ